MTGDLNADLSTGWYQVVDAPNAPSTGWYWVEVIRHNALHCVQNAYGFVDHSYYQRVKDSGKWGDWSPNLFQAGADAKAHANSVANQAEAKAKAHVDGMPWQRHKVTADDGAAIDISGRDLNTIVKTGFYKGAHLGNT
ncbi:pyocin knob domain-containing protein, partial [Paenibacillus popilliae]|uniref:pyocin knob domain-containing protein n=1 Tax=Paenibacillus popilliae TaxID=78057 RepID=UPI001F43CE3F